MPSRASVIIITISDEIDDGDYTVAVINF